MKTGYLSLMDRKTRSTKKECLQILLATAVAALAASVFLKGAPVINAFASTKDAIESAVGIPLKILETIFIMLGGVYMVSGIVKYAIVNANDQGNEQNAVLRITTNAPNYPKQKETPKIYLGFSETKPDMYDIRFLLGLLNNDPLRRYSYICDSVLEGITKMYIPSVKKTQKIKKQFKTFIDKKEKVDTWENIVCEFGNYKNVIWNQDLINAIYQLILSSLDLESVGYEVALSVYHVDIVNAPCMSIYLRNSRVEDTKEYFDAWNLVSDRLSFTVHGIGDCLSKAIELLIEPDDLANSLLFLEESINKLIIKYPRRENEIIAFWHCCENVFGSYNVNQTKSM